MIDGNPGFIRSALADDPELQPLVARFIESARTRGTQILQACEAHDVNRVSELVHQLKGSGGSYGFPALAASCRQLEAVCREENGNWQRIQAAADDVWQILQRLAL